MRMREPRFILPWASSMGTLLRHFPHQTASRIFIWAQHGISSHLARASGAKSGNLLIESVIFHLPCPTTHWTDNFQATNRWLTSVSVSSSLFFAYFLICDLNSLYRFIGTLINNQPYPMFNLRGAEISPFSRFDTRLNCNKCRAGGGPNPAF